MIMRGEIRWLSIICSQFFYRSTNVEICGFFSADKWSKKNLRSLIPHADNFYRLPAEWIQPNACSRAVRVINVTWVASATATG